MGHCVMHNALTYYKTTTYGDYLHMKLIHGEAIEEMDKPVE